MAVEAFVPGPPTGGASTSSGSSVSSDTASRQTTALEPTQETHGYTLEGDQVVNDAFLEGFSFWDLLDIINPLQHIPIVSSIYRNLTNDELKAGPRLAGGFLFGGPFGLAGSAMNVLLEEMSGQDLGAHAIAMVSGDTTGGATPGSPAAPQYASAGLMTDAVSAGGADRDPTQPLSLLPTRWQQSDGAVGSVPAVVLSASGSAMTGGAPLDLPLGYEALATMPAGGQGGSPAGAGVAVPMAPPSNASVPAEAGAVAGSAASQVETARASAQTTGQAPTSLPLGYEALAAITSGPQSLTEPPPAAPSASPATSSVRGRGRVDLILPEDGPAAPLAGSGAQAAPTPVAGSMEAQAASSGPPDSLPLGYDALMMGGATPGAGAAPSAAGSAAAPTMAAAPAPGAAEDVAADPRGQRSGGGLAGRRSGMTLADYRAQARGRAPIPGSLTASPAPASGTAPRPLTDPATTTALLGQTLDGPAPTRVGETLRVPAAPPGVGGSDVSSSSAPVGTLDSGDRSMPQSGSAPGSLMPGGAAAGASGDAGASGSWFMRQMIGNLEKYQNARGAIPPAGSGTQIDA